MYFFSKFRKVFLIILAASIFTLPFFAQAQDARYSSLVINADTGEVLHQENAGKTRYPASLTKMMTLYLTFQALDRGGLTMNKMLRASVHASQQKPSVIGLDPGQNISVRDAINAVVIKSANDASVVLAEATAGSEAKFAAQMTRTAKNLGMNHTIFTNASGLPDNRQVTTAYDLARLAIALRRDYPHYYPLFAKDSFTYNGHTVYSHNRVTKNYRGADGLKTGYIRASGFNLVTSARRGGKSIVGVVMGGRSIKSRDTNMIKLLDQAFSKMNKLAVTNVKYINKSALKDKYKDKLGNDSEEDGDDSADSAETKKNNPATYAVSKKNLEPAVQDITSSSGITGAEKFSRNVVISDEAPGLGKQSRAALAGTGAIKDSKRDIFSPASGNVVPDTNIRPIRVRLAGKRVPVPLLRSFVQERRMVKSAISISDRKISFAEAK